MRRLKCFCCFDAGIHVIATRSSLALNCGFMMMTLGFDHGYVGADTVLPTDAEIEELVCVIGSPPPDHADKFLDPGVYGHKRFSTHIPMIKPDTDQPEHTHNT